MGQMTILRRSFPIMSLSSPFAALGRQATIKEGFGSSWTPKMPRFAANLAYLFTERPFIERFGAAAAAGFTAVELQFPYDHTPSAVKAEIDRHGLTQLGVNTPFGRDGEFGLAAVPGREREFDRFFRQALDYIVAIDGRAIHCLAGKIPPEQRPAAEQVFIA